MTNFKKIGKRGGVYFNLKIRVKTEETVIKFKTNLLAILTLTLDSAIPRALVALMV